VTLKGSARKIRNTLESKSEYEEKETIVCTEKVFFVIAILEAMLQLIERTRIEQLVPLRKQKENFLEMC
jgi:hypothetical protein